MTVLSPVGEVTVVVQIIAGDLRNARRSTARLETSVRVRPAVLPSLKIPFAPETPPVYAYVIVPPVGRVTFAILPVVQVVPGSGVHGPLVGVEGVGSY